MGNEISSASGIIGFAEGSTWDTAVTVTKKLRLTSLTVSTNRGVVGSTSHNTRKRGKAKLGAETVTVNGSGPLLFAGEWLDLFEGFMGTASARAEQTVSQGDDLVTIDMSDTNDTFWTLAYLAESDVVEEIPSFKITSVTISGADNAPGTFSFQGIGSRLINTAGSATNATGDLTGLSYGATEEDAVFTGTNLYYRVGDYSTGTALSSSNDLVAKTFSFTYSKPVGPRHGMRGASTHRTLLPLDSGMIDCSQSVTLESVDDSTIDLLAKYNAGTDLMSELFVDGYQIGTGLNRSLKFQFAAQRALTPGERGYTGQATITQPTLNTTSFTAAAAPSGMTGVTYLRVTSIDDRA